MKAFLTRKVTLPVWGRAVPIWVLGLLALFGIGLASGGGDEADVDPVVDTNSVPVEDQLPRAETSTTVTIAPLAATTTLATAAPTTVATAPPTTRAPAPTTTKATAPATAAPTTQPPTTAPPTTAAPTTAPVSTYYANCAAARAAGAAPVHRGDPGYGSHLDRDGDGVGCE